MAKVIDNFLEPEKFAIIKEIVGGPDFPWYYQEFINEFHAKEVLGLES